MNKLVLFGSMMVIVGALTVAKMAPTHAADACARKSFQTALVKDACQKGGQAGAKDAMKAFMKKAKMKDCKACHSKLAPAYELKTDGLATFKKAGGV